MFRSTALIRLFCNGHYLYLCSRQQFEKYQQRSADSFDSYTALVKCWLSVMIKSILTGLNLEGRCKVMTSIHHLYLSSKVKGVFVIMACLQSRWMKHTITIKSLTRFNGWGKLPPFRRRHFPMHFLEWNLWISIKISLKFVPQGSNWQYSSIGSNNGLAPTRRQAIIWT